MICFSVSLGDVQQPLEATLEPVNHPINRAPDPADNHTLDCVCICFHGLFGFGHFNVKCLSLGRNLFDFLCGLARRPAGSSAAARFTKGIVS